MKRSDKDEEITTPVKIESWKPRILNDETIISIPSTRCEPDEIINVLKDIQPQIFQGKTITKKGCDL